MPEVAQTFLAFCQQLGLCVLLIVALSASRGPSARWTEPIHQLVTGIIFGSAAVLAMLTAVRLGAGVQADVRNVVVALAAPFGGPIAAIMTAACAAAYRAMLGGSGVTAALCGIGACTILGLVLSLARKNGKYRIRDLFLLAAGVSLVTPVTFFVFVPDGWNVYRSVALPQTLANFGGTGVLGLILLQERRRRELSIALASGVARLGAITNNVADALITIGPGDRIEAFNASAERLFGFQAFEVVGRDVRMLMPEPYRSSPESFVDLCHSGGAAFTPSAAREFEGVSKDGAPVPVEVRIAPFHLDSECFVTASIRDLTERKIASAAIRERDNQLLQARKMEAIGQLTGGIAHDFNNLLTVVIGNAEILAEDLADPMQRELARTIQDAAERGSDLTQHLLAFGRRQTLKPERLRLDQVVAAMMPLLRRTISENIEITSQHQNAERVALTDRTLLESALLNLVVNAKDAMLQGGTLTILTGERYATTTDGQLPAGQPVVFITIGDTGTGMSPDVIEHVFEPFFTTKEVGKGTGLGLSMVYGFAQQSGGHVSIESREGEGTTVTIVLPAVDSSPIDEAPEQGAAAPLAGGEMVLVVEDEPQVRHFLCSQLVGLGYRVEAVSAGPDALEVLRTSAPVDLLFTDVVLPKGMSGVELAVRARQLRPGLKVLLTSGYPEEVFEHHGRPDETMRLLRKPYRRKELASVLRQVLDS